MKIAVSKSASMKRTGKNTSRHHTKAPKSKPRVLVRSLSQKLSPDETAIGGAVTFTVPQIEASTLLQSITKQAATVADPTTEGIGPTTAQLFKEAGIYLSAFRAGKIPKALRMIPTLNNWQSMLTLTNPQSWTDHAIQEMTPMFLSMPDNDARRYMTNVLLPHAKRGIRRGRLTPQLYQALCRCASKPGEFLKAIYFPLILDDSINLKSVMILNSVIGKQSFPATHVAATILKLTSLEAASNKILYCLLQLLQKNHALPPMIIASTFEYLTSRDFDGPSPVIWYQCILQFVHQWRHELTIKQKEQITQVVTRNMHEGLTREIVFQLHH